MLRLILPLLLVLNACSQINTGRIDFRRADIEKAHRGKTITELMEGFQSQCSVHNKVEICQAPLLSRLDRKALSIPSRSINPGDVFSIRLDYGVVANMTELYELQTTGITQVGEIAVLVQAFEFSSKGTAEQDVFGFLDITGTKKNNESDAYTDNFQDAKVVYFGVDVRKKQSLNFSNIPVMGPVKYNGRPIGLQVIVLELDQLSEPATEVFKDLAELGKTTLSADPLNAALLDLGNSMIKGAAQDDVIFEYRMVMDNSSGWQPSANFSANAVSSFEEGRLVFRRLEKRTSIPVWRNLRLDENSGALVVLESDKSQTTNGTEKDQVETNRSSRDDQIPRYKSYRSFSKETYFTFNVINHGPNAPETEYKYRTFSELRDAFEAYVNNSAVEFDNLEDEIEKLRVQKEFNDHIEPSNEMLQSTLGAWNKYASALIRKPGEDVDSCSPTDLGAPKPKLAVDAEYTARVATMNLEAHLLELIDLYDPADNSKKERNTTIEKYVQSLPLRIINQLGSPGPGNVVTSKSGVDLKKNSLVLSYSEWRNRPNFVSVNDFKTNVLNAQDNDVLSKILSEAAKNRAWEACLAEFRVKHSK